MEKKNLQADGFEKNYNHKKYEKFIYDLWNKSGYFNPDKLKIKNSKEKGKEKSFCIIMPPPNANGSLHMGHAVFVYLQDIMIRFWRQYGYRALWLPGTDHAGIATQVVFERELAKKGINRFDLGREKFFKECYKFSIKNKENIETQLMKLGASCDWSRNSFTLEKRFFKPIYTVFKMLYDKGLIYRDYRMVNWCPRCKTVLSDLEVELKKERVKLYYIKYPLEKNKNKFITIATTRPETMLGDTAIAVNPKDKRYKNLVSKYAILPFIGRKLKIIEDEKVDPDFGTGALKITPSHDFNDYELAKKHNLEFVQVIGFDDKITENGEKFKGIEKFEARKLIVKELKQKGLLEKIEDYDTYISKCERCKATIEPMISLQWFVKTKKLSKKAIEVVKSGRIKIIPKRFEKIYFNWMENLKDWCISRQLWWGHQIPVYYCGTELLSPLQVLMNKIKPKKGCSKFFVSVEKPKECPFCKGKNIIQDPDTLDTWFSSGQWPFNTLGWIDKSDDFKRFYPTSVMETGYDILFFWVARMIMLGVFATKKIPFEYVYLHGLIRDKFGEKMSKSKGNVIDPVIMVEKYGSDSLRLSLISKITPGSDLIIYEEKIKGARHFVNKVWNISRFLYLNIKNLKDFKIDKFNIDFSLIKDLDISSKWIIKKFIDIKKEYFKNFYKFRFGICLDLIYEFLWDNFADWFVELVKIKDKNKNIRLKIASVIFYDFIKLCHPFIPFVSELINLKFQKFLSDKKLLLIKDNKVNYKISSFIFKKEYLVFEKTKESIKFIRSIKEAYKIKNKVKIYIRFEKNLSGKEKEEIKKLISELANVILQEKELKENRKDVISRDSTFFKIYFTISKNVNKKDALLFLKNKSNKLAELIDKKRSLLSNKNFLKKAPKDLIEKEKLKFKSLEEEYKKIIMFISYLKF